MANCRFCGKELEHLFVSLGKAPLSNSFLDREELDREEPVYPLDVYVCDGCFLVQLPGSKRPEEIFSEYAYFSSYSDTWLEHARRYADKMTGLFGINENSLVMEVASNDGYLLQYFKEKKVPVLGIEPALNVARAARDKGIPTETVFLGKDTAKDIAVNRGRADLLVGNNVLAHVPDINDFVEGVGVLLKRGGVITMEFPHLMRLIEDIQFDTIYHEHFSYFSFITAEKIFAAHGLVIFDVEEIPTHGGSLRIYVRHGDNTGLPVSERVRELKRRETDAGYADIEHYMGFDGRVRKVKKDVVRFFDEARAEGKKVAGYGAAAKGNTLLNYCGIDAGAVDYVADKNPYKQGRFLPGSRIPVETPEKIKETKPDYVLILPWNIRQEITDQLGFVREWGGRFVTVIPKVRVF